MSSRAIGSVRTGRQHGTGLREDGEEYRSAGAELDMEAAMKIATLIQQAAADGAVKVGWHHRPSDNRLNLIAYFD